MRKLGTFILVALALIGPVVAAVWTMAWLTVSRSTSPIVVMLSGGAVFLSGLGLVFLWTHFRNKSEARVLFEVDDETLGRIQVRRNDWKATQFVVTLNREIKINAERGELVPTPEQAALWVEIIYRLDDLLTKARHALQGDAENSAGKEYEFQTTELELTEVSLDADGGFSFGLEIPRLKERLPDGFYALFTDFEVVEACYVH